LDSLFDLALVSGGNLLRLEAAAGSTEAAIGNIHRFLECIALPTEDVVAMLTIASRVASAENERL